MAGLGDEIVKTCGEPAKKEATDLALKGDINKDNVNTLGKSTAECVGAVAGAAAGVAGCALIGIVPPADGGLCAGVGAIIGKYIVGALYDVLSSLFGSPQLSPKEQFCEIVGKGGKNETCGANYDTWGQGTMELAQCTMVQLFYFWQQAPHRKPKFGQAQGEIKSWLLNVIANQSIQGANWAIFGQNYDSGGTQSNNIQGFSKDFAIWSALYPDDYSAFRLWVVNNSAGLSGCYKPENAQKNLDTFLGLGAACYYGATNPQNALDVAKQFDNDFAAALKKISDDLKGGAPPPAAAAKKSKGEALLSIAGGILLLAGGLSKEIE